MISRGSIKACVMQIMFVDGNFRLKWLFIWLALAVSGNVVASPPLSWVSNEDDRASMELADGSVYELELDSEISGVFYDKNKHLVAGNYYVSTFHVLPSPPIGLKSFCGAGAEVVLFVYKATRTKLTLHAIAHVSSCLRSFSLASQNSGQEAQEFDFSSVRWEDYGFSIEWFGKVDDEGRPLRVTNYFFIEDHIFTDEILGDEHSIE